MINFNIRKHKNNSAFTMLELVMVIVVIGIITSLANPRYERDIRQEASTSIVSALKYTKHMALTDNVTNPRDDKWQRAFWRFGIQKCSDNGIFYYIAADKSYGGNIDGSEYINDPANGLKMMGSNAKPCETEPNNGASPNIFLTKNYGIKDGGVTFTNCDPMSGPTSAKHIGFDYFGRTYRGFTGSDDPDYSSRVHTDCKITFDFSNQDIDSLNIIIESGTGYIYVEE